MQTAVNIALGQFLAKYVSMAHILIEDRTKGRVSALQVYCLPR